MLLKHRFNRLQFNAEILTNDSFWLFLGWKNQLRVHKMEETSLVSLLCSCEWELFEEQGRKDQKDTYRIMYDEIVFIVD